MEEILLVYFFLLIIQYTYQEKHALLVPLFTKLLKASLPYEFLKKRKKKVSQSYCTIQWQGNIFENVCKMLATFTVVKLERKICSCLCPIHWSQALSWEWRCSWSSADRRCSNYIWVINNFITYEGATYIRGLTVHTRLFCTRLSTPTRSRCNSNNFWRFSWKKIEHWNEK